MTIPTGTPTGGVLRLADGPTVGRLGTLDEIAARYGATRVQTVLAWLLARSPVTLAIPGTASLAHLEENLAAARLDLTADDVAVLDGLA